MPEKGSFTILYGSQTGQAKAIAEEIHEKSTHNDLKASIFCLSLTEKKVSEKLETEFCCYANNFFNLVSLFHNVIIPTTR